MNALTQSIAIRGVDLSDRLVMPPMASGKPNPDGTVSDSLVEYYKEKSQGGYLGLVITEHAFVCQQGKAHGGQLSIAREEDIPGLRRLADAIHNNGVKAVAQISHAGGAANPQDTGMEPVSASAVQSPRAKAGAPLPRAMTVGEIQAVVEAFAQAACRAQEAGFDGVELHAAHGYLLNQFYSPLTNHRTDAYTGATLAGRLRFLLEAVEAVRAAVGQEFLLAVRLGTGDDMPGGTRGGLPPVGSGQGRPCRRGPGAAEGLPLGEKGCIHRSGQRMNQIAVLPDFSGMIEVLGISHNQIIGCTV